MLKQYVWQKCKEAFASLAWFAIIALAIDLWIWYLIPSADQTPAIIMAVLTLISCYYRFIKKVKFRKS